MFAIVFFENDDPKSVAAPFASTEEAGDYLTGLHDVQWTAWEGHFVSLGNASLSRNVRDKAYIVNMKKP